MLATGLAMHSPNLRADGEECFLSDGLECPSHSTPAGNYVRPRARGQFGTLQLWVVQASYLGDLCRMAKLFHANVA